jgi:hypothetical protein
MAKKKYEDRVLVTAWVDEDLRTQANIAGQLLKKSVTDMVIEALEAAIAEAKAKSDEVAA